MLRERVVLDANLLVLLIVGSTSPSYIGRHKRLKAYAESDFALLLGLISSAQTIVATPNVLTEASNLVGQIGEPARTEIYRCFRAFIATIDERYVASRAAVARREFLRLGLSDAALLDFAGSSEVLLTADLDLYLAALAHGRQAENFNHHRDA